MPFKNPFDVPPKRAAELPGQKYATGELGENAPDALADSEKAPPPPPGEPLPFEFTGTAEEYARLWFAGLLLSALSLGLYSPWSKVARERYLASHTLLGGVPFVYHGRPLPILKGRLAAAAILGAGWGLATYSPSLGPWLLALAILVAPWFLLQTLAFDAANYSWRGLRFRFRAPYREAAVAVLPLLAWPAADIAAQFADNPANPLLLVFPYLVLAWTWPWMVSSITRMRFGGLHYGTADFALAATSEDFYKVYFRGMGGAFLTLGVIAIIIVIVLGSFAGPNTAAMLQSIALVVISAFAIGMARGRRFNLGLHRLTGGGRIRFRSTLEPNQLAKLFALNALWIVGTAGLASPWRRIVTLRERVRHVTAFVDGPLGWVRRAAPAGAGTTGSALAEGIDFDLSL
ncbi:MAG: DUF898 family protein [Betaproteobacteria bacterium]